MSAVVEELPALKQAALKKFPREVRDIILDLVNNYGVRHRMPDGSHILLYSGARNTRPYKISAQRGGEQSVQHLNRWIERNLPDYGKETAVGMVDVNSEVLKPADEEIPSVAPIKAVVQRAQSAQKAVDEIIAKHEKDTRNWVIFKEDTPDARVSDFLYYDADGIGCVACDYRSVNKIGTHLHENKHTGKATELAKQGGAIRSEKAEARKAAQEQAKSDAMAAVETLQTYLGMTSDQSEVERLVAENERLTGEIESIRKELEEAQTKMHLIQEAMGL